jgi:hypothetical protein
VIYGKQIWTWAERDENRLQVLQITKHIMEKKSYIPYKLQLGKSQSTIWRNI